MPRSSSLAIMIMHTATDAPADPGEIRALIDAAIEHMTQLAGLAELPEPIGPSGAAAGAGKTERGPGPAQDKPESVEWFRAVLAAPRSDAEQRRRGIAVRVSALAG